MVAPISEPIAATLACAHWSKCARSLSKLTRKRILSNTERPMANATSLSLLFQA